MDKCTSLKRSTSIKSQSSFGVYFTEDLIEKKLINDIPDRERYITLVKSFYKGIVDEKSYIKNYFTKDGLDLFVEDGLFDDIPKSYMDDKSVQDFIVKLTKDDKFFFLNSLYNDIEKDIIHSRAIDTSQFSLSKTISIAYYDMEYIERRLNKSYTIRYAFTQHYNYFNKILLSCSSIASQNLKMNVPSLPQFLVQII